MLLYPSWFWETRSFRHFGPLVPCLCSTTAAIRGTRVKNDGWTVYSNHVGSWFVASLAEMMPLSPAKSRPISERLDALIDTFGSHQGLLPAEHSRCKSQSDTNLPEWTYQVLSLHMKSCFPVWSHWNLPFPLKLFLLSFLLRVEGLMEQKRLRCSVVRDHLNNKFNLCFSVMSLLSSPFSFFYFFPRVYMSTEAHAGCDTERRAGHRAGQQRSPEFPPWWMDRLT